MKLKRIILCLLAFSLIICFAGCSSVPVCSAEQAQTAILDEFTECTAKMSSSSNSFLKALIENAEITVTDVKKQKKALCAECEIANYNAAEVLKTFESSTKEVTVNDGLNMLKEALTKTEKITLKTDIIINYSKNDGYTAALTEEQLDAMLGGFIAYCAQQK